MFEIENGDKVEDLSLINYNKDDIFHPFYLGRDAVIPD